MKKLLVLACLTVALAPHSAKAGDHDWDDKPKHHRHMRANEIAGIGIGVAAIVGVAGYLLLRRRHAD